MAASKQPFAIPAGLNQDTREIKLCKTCKIETIVVKYPSCSLDGFEINKLWVKNSMLQYFCNRLPWTVRKNFNSILEAAGRQIYLRIKTCMKTLNNPVKFI